MSEGAEKWKEKEREEHGKEESGEERLSREEVREVLRELKSRKAAGSDGLVNKIWKYFGEQSWKRQRKSYATKWKGERMPEEWKEGIIVLIVKKKGGQSMKDYRGGGVTLMTASYKIYTTILAKQLRWKMEEGGMLPDNQAGFRKTIVNNIYILNWLIGREVKKKGERLLRSLWTLKRHLIAWKG